MPRKINPWEVRTEDAARELGTDKMTLIYKIEHKIIPIGDVVRIGRTGKADVSISRKLLDEYKASWGIP